jgi:hypothetical protein
MISKPAPFPSDEALRAVWQGVRVAALLALVALLLTILPT